MGPLPLRALILALGVGLFAFARANAADIAIDLDDNSVLLANDPDAVRRPASLVKLMTGYIAFEALESGVIAEDSPVVISSHAAKRPPVKLGLRAGETLPFIDLLGAALVGSKNDAATAVAEAVAGAEPEFVARMNAAAGRLGMVNTTYANATGLPAAGQQTSARDIALLATALLRDFPERSALFARRSVRADGQSVSTTNPLFGRVAGARGMKTGFTCAAGYSIAGFVESDGRRILAVTLGHPDKSSRLTAVRRLIDAARDVPPGGPKMAIGLPGAETPPDIRACSGRGAEIVATDIPLPVDADLFLAGVVAAPRPLAPPVVPPQAVPEPPQAAPPPIPTPTRRTQLPARPAGPPPLAGWAAYLGAFATERAALQATSAVAARAGLNRDSAQRTLSRPRDGRSLGLIYRLERRQSLAACEAARAAGLYCLSLSPERLLNERARWRR